ncbi:MAG: sigma-70 family RNA polymerase sigma factor [Pseudomonadota bacterium]
MDVADNDEELQWWRQARELDDAYAKENLVEHYMPLVRQCAAKVMSAHPPGIEFSDYLQFGVVGLLEAIAAFDYSRAIPFSAFGRHRIEGAIRNGIERFSERNAQISAAKRAARDRIGSIKAEESAKDEDELFANLVEVTLGLAVGFLLEDGQQPEKLNVQRFQSPFASTEMAELTVFVQQSVNELPTDEQQVIRLHYFHQMKFVDIANLLSKSKGRIAQIHKQALTRIRERLQKPLANDVMNY